MLTSLLAALVTCAVCAAEVDVSNKQSNHNNEITLEDGDPKAEAFKFDSLLNELHSSQQEQGPLWTRGTVALPGWGNMYDMYQQHQDDAYSPDSQFSDGHSNKADDVFNAVERGGTSLNYVQAPDNALELDGYGHNSPTLSNDPWDDRGGPHHSQSKDRSEMNEDLEDGGQSFEDPKLGKQPIHDGGGRDWSGMNGNMGMYNMPGAMPWGGLSQQQKYLPTMSQQKLYNKINPMQNQMYGYGFNSPFWGNQQPWRSMYPTQLGLSYQGYGGMQGFGQLGAPMMGGHMLGGFNQFGSGFNQMAGANNQGFNKMAGTEQQGSNQAASQLSIEQNLPFPSGFTQQSHLVDGKLADAQHLKKLQQPPAGQQQQSHRQQPQQNPITSQQQHQYPQQTFKHEPPHGLHQTHPQRQHQAQPLRQREQYHQTHRQQPQHPQRNRQHERPQHPQRNRQHERPHHPQHNRQHERPHHPQRNRLHRPQPQNQAQSQHQARPERQHQAQSQLYQTQQSLKHRHQPSKHQSHNFKQHERPQNAQQQRQHLNQQQQSRRHQQQLYHQKQ